MKMLYTHLLASQKADTCMQPIFAVTQVTGRTVVLHVISMVCIIELMALHDGKRVINGQV